MNKKHLTESDIRARYITPAIEQAGWNPMTQVFHEFGLRAGRISVRSKKAHRDASTIIKADYPSNTLQAWCREVPTFTARRTIPHRHPCQRTPQPLR